jgi:hypothetical protein
MLSSGPNAPVPMPPKHYTVAEGRKLVLKLKMQNTGWRLRRDWTGSLQYEIPQYAPKFQALRLPQNFVSSGPRFGWITVWNPFLYMRNDFTDEAVALAEALTA